DACGNETRHTQVVTVEDVTAPVVSACINDSTIYTSSISCNISIPDFTSDTQLAVSDNCGTLMDGTIVVTQYPVAGSILEVGTHVVTIFATDVCNNVDSCQFILTVADTISPIITNCPADMTVSADAGSCDATGVNLDRKSVV